MGNQSISTCKKLLVTKRHMRSGSGALSTWGTNLQTTYTITLVTNTIVAESIKFVWLYRASHDLTSWPSG